MIRSSSSCLLLAASLLLASALPEAAHANPPQGPRISKSTAVKLIKQDLKTRWDKDEKASFGKFPGYKIEFEPSTASNAASWKFWDEQFYTAIPKGTYGDFSKGPYARTGLIDTTKNWNSPQGEKRILDTPFPEHFGKLHF